MSTPNIFIRFDQPDVSGLDDRTAPVRREAARLARLLPTDAQFVNSRWLLTFGGKSGFLVKSDTPAETVISLLPKSVLAEEIDLRELATASSELVAQPS